MSPDHGDRSDRNDPIPARLARHAVGIVLVLLLSWGLGMAGVFPVANWVVPAAFVAATVAIVAVYRLFPAPTRRDANIRAAGQSLGLAAVSYSTGWGFVLPLVHLFAVADNVDEGGSEATSAALLWAAVGTAAGQVAIAVGVAPIAIDDVVTSHLLAAASLLLVALVARRLTRTAQAREEARRALVRREARFRALVEDAADVVLVLDERRRVSWASPSTPRVLGEELADGAAYLDRVHPDDRERIDGLLAAAATETVRPGPTLFRLAGADGWIEVEGRHRDLRDDPAVGGYVASLRDVTERERLHAEVERSRTHDPVTGLRNRRALSEAVERAAAAEQPVGLVELHVVGLRAMVIADGRPAADQMLREVARRLEGLPGGDDLLARTDDQTFALLLASSDDGELDRVARAAHRLAGAVCATHDPSLHVAVGVATSTDGEQPGELFQCVRIASEHAMAGATPPRIERFYAGLRLELERRITIERALPAAIAAGQFRLVYQPVVVAGPTPSLAGVEALLRWTHPQFGELGPGLFVPIAERTGHIVELGAWVVDEAARQLAAWDEALGEGTVGYVSVNVSARQLGQGDLADRVSDALAPFGIAPHRLLVELTESALADDVETAASQLQQLSALGVRLALDDFGTGWASMASLQQFPFDVLKIDRAFVSHASARRRPEMLASMVALGRDLGLEVVAEGVEDTAELDEVTALGADLIQGWYFGKPQRPDELTARLRDGAAW